MAQPPHLWTAEDVARYLRALHLEERYVEVFVREGVTGIVLMELTADDLRDEPFSLTALVPRKTVLGAIKRMSAPREAGALLPAPPAPAEVAQGAAAAPSLRDARSASHVNAVRALSGAPKAGLFSSVARLATREAQAAEGKAIGRRRNEWRMHGSGEEWRGLGVEEYTKRCKDALGVYIGDLRKAAQGGFRAPAEGKVLCPLPAPDMQPASLDDFHSDPGDRTGTILEWVMCLPAAAASHDETRGIPYSDADARDMAVWGANLLTLVHAELDDPGSADYSVCAVKGYGAPADSGAACREHLKACVAALAAIGVDPAVAADELFAVFLYTHQMLPIGDPKPLRREVHSGDRSLFSVMNWAMRVSRDPGTDWAELKHAFTATLALFRPLMVRVDTFLCRVPPQRRTVYRGLSRRVSQQYKLGTVVAWDAFSSTAVDRSVAQAFSGGGTLFVIHIFTAGSVDFVSRFPGEAEALLSCNTAFVVRHKLSRTVLNMLRAKADIVTMQQLGDDPTPAEQVAAFAASQEDLRPMYAPFLEEYVEGRVAPLPPPCADDASTPIFTFLSSWCAGPPDPALLLGVGGTGKTSATLAALCHLARSVPGVIAVFVPLPSVVDVGAAGALDRHVLAQVGFRTADMDEALARHRVCLFFDSLDETALRGEAALTGLFDRNPIVARAHCVVSCRPEFLADHGAAPGTVLTTRRPTVVQYVQPFVPEDVATLIHKKQHAWEAAEGDKDKVDVAAVLAAMRLPQAVLHTPLTLAMAADVVLRLRGPPPLPDGAHSATRGDIYEHYLRAVGRGGGQSSVDALLRRLEVVAMRMLNNNSWQLPMHAVLEEVEDVATVEQCIPCRVEDPHDPAASFAFSHKTIAEYLVARRLWREPRALDDITRAFSLDTPEVILFYAEMALRSVPSTRCRDEAVASTWAAWVRDASRPHRASNALALTCAADYPMWGFDLSGVRIAHCNLHQARLRGACLRGAVLEESLLFGASFQDADIDGAAFPGCGAGFGEAPLDVPGVQALALSPDHTCLAAVTNSAVYVFDARTRGLLGEVQLGHHFSGGSCLYGTFAPMFGGCDGRCLAVGGRGGVVVVDTAAQPYSTTELAMGDSVSRCVAVALAGPEAEDVVVAGSTLEVYSRTSGARVAAVACSCAYDNYEAYPRALMPLPHASRRVLVASNVNGLSAGGLCLFDCASAAFVYTFALSEPASQFVLSRDQAVLAVNVSGWYVQLYACDWGAAEPRGLITMTQKVEEDNFTRIAFSPDAKRLYLSGSGFARAWDIAARGEVGRYGSHVDDLSDVAVTDQHVVFTACRNDQAVGVWNADGVDASFRPLRPAAGSTFTLRCYDVTSDGKYLVTFDDSGRGIVWDVESGAALRDVPNWDRSQSADGVRFTKHTHEMIIGHHLGLVVVASCPDVQVEPSVTFEGPGSVYHVAAPDAAPANTHFAAAVAWNGICVYDRQEKASKLWNVRAEEGDDAYRTYSLEDVIMSPDGRFVVAHGCGFFAVWEHALSAAAAASGDGFVTMVDSLTAIAAAEHAPLHFLAVVCGVPTAYEYATGASAYKVAAKVPQGPLMWCMNPFTARQELIASDSRRGVKRFSFGADGDDVEACVLLPNTPMVQTFVSARIPVLFDGAMRATRFVTCSSAFKHALLWDATHVDEGGGCKLERTYGVEEKLTAQGHIGHLDPAGGTPGTLALHFRS
eukprot:TRINITY_DN4872_c0_g1_i1.p1 TRINITY_DN4872_c0_g1~~TRINITY_DN4872_c0_g1_i1.p1  ORF type:complete len:1694 (+),score=451.34 TRINITY_DN4872_c0_g1_i1:47-5128(+)